MPKVHHLRTLVAVPRDIMDAIDAARAVQSTVTQETVSRSAMIRILLRRALETPQPLEATPDD